jgi:hypothetical protein
VILNSSSNEVGLVRRTFEAGPPRFSFDRGGLGGAGGFGPSSMGNGAGHPILYIQYTYDISPPAPPQRGFSLEKKRWGCQKTAPPNPTSGPTFLLFSILIPPE